MRLYTKGGDRGRTSLVGGERVEKTDQRVEAYGAMDELTSHLGYLHDKYLVDTPYCADMIEIMSRLMDAQAVVATPEDLESKVAISDLHIAHIETCIDQLSSELPVLTNFTLPAGCEAMSYANVCRTVCRRAERELLRVQGGERLRNVAIFVNRLSDYLYALGRSLVVSVGGEEILWHVGLQIPKK